VPVKVSQLWRYPVKSMVGESVSAVRIDGVGVVGDRTWAARDLERGGIRGAKKIGGLMRFAARSDADGHAVITLPDGQEVRTDHPQVDHLVSEALGHPIRLEALRPASDVEHYRRGAPDSDDVMVELRDIFGREGDEPIPDLSIFPPEIIEFESPPGTYYDAFPLMVMTTSALRSLAEALPDSVIDVRRFRPSMVIDTGDATGHPEFDWVGRTATIGSATVRFRERCPRCVMITREIDREAPADRAILRHVVSELGQDVGIYAEVTAPGLVTVGDPLTFDPAA
jgi:uncharacterized protein